MSTLKNIGTGAVVASLMAALMMTTTSGFASEDDDRRGYGMRSDSGWGWRMGRGADMRFGAIDQNDDGVINDDEAAANAESVFVQMDADDSGGLTEDEFMAVRMGPQLGRNKARQAARQDQKKARFPTMDADKNKTVSQAEFMAAAQQRFIAADGNKDGTVTPWEFRAQRRIF